MSANQMIGSGARGVKTDFSKSAGTAAVRRGFIAGRSAKGALNSDADTATKVGHKAGRAVKTANEKRGRFGVAAGVTAGAASSHEVSKAGVGRLVRSMKRGNAAARLASGKSSAERAMDRKTNRETANIAGLVGAGAIGGASIDRTVAQRRQNGDGVSKGLLAAVSKSNGMTVLPTHVSIRQAPRDPLGRFASHDNAYTLAHTTPKRNIRGKAVVGRGKSVLAPAHTSRLRTRPANSNSPNGAGMGRRLTDH